MAAVVHLTAQHPTWSLLTPFLAQRIGLYAFEHEKIVPPAQVVAESMARLWAADPSFLALGIVDDNGKLVGHVLAQQQGPVVTISQLRADTNVGDALTEAVTRIAEWAKVRGAQHVLLATSRDGREWEKRLGFKRIRTISHLSLAPVVEAPPDDQ